MLDGIKIGDAYWAIGANIEGLNRALGDAQRRVDSTMGNLLKTSRRVGVAMTAVGGAMAGGLTLAVKRAVDFQGALAEVSTLGVRDMAAMRKSIESVAMATGTDLI